MVVWKTWFENRTRIEPQRHTHDKQKIRVQVCVFYTTKATKTTATATATLVSPLRHIITNCDHKFCECPIN